MLSSARPALGAAVQFFATCVKPDAVAHLAFVTGPSRTGDIELTLTRSVHGPKAVHMILIRP